MTQINAEYHRMLQLHLLIRVYPLCITMPLFTHNRMWSGRALWTAVFLLSLSQTSSTSVSPTDKITTATEILTTTPAPTTITAPTTTSAPPTTPTPTTSAPTTIPSTTTATASTTVTAPTTTPSPTTTPAPTTKVSTTTAGSTTSASTASTITTTTLLSSTAAATTTDFTVTLTSIQTTLATITPSSPTSQQATASSTQPETSESTSINSNSRDGAQGNYSTTIVPENETSSSTANRSFYTTEDINISDYVLSSIKTTALIRSTDTTSVTEIRTVNSTVRWNDSSILTSPSGAGTANVSTILTGLWLNTSTRPDNSTFEPALILENKQLQAKITELNAQVQSVTIAVAVIAALLGLCILFAIIYIAVKCLRSEPTTPFDRIEQRGNNPHNFFWPDSNYDVLGKKEGQSTTVRQSYLRREHEMTLLNSEPLGTFNSQPISSSDKISSRADERAHVYDNHGATLDKRDKVGIEDKSKDYVDVEMD